MLEVRGAEVEALTARGLPNVVDQDDSGAIAGALGLLLLDETLDV